MILKGQSLQYHGLSQHSRCSKCLMAGTNRRVNWSRAFSSNIVIQLAAKVNLLVKRTHGHVITMFAMFCYFAIWWKVVASACSAVCPRALPKVIFRQTFLIVTLDGRPQNDFYGWLNTTPQLRRNFTTYFAFCSFPNKLLSLLLKGPKCTFSGTIVCCLTRCCVAAMKCLFSRKKSLHAQLHMKAIIKHLGRPTKAQRPESQLLGSFEENVKASCFLVTAKRDY